MAQPLASPPDLLTSLIGSQDLQNLVAAVPTEVPSSGSATPNWQYLRTCNEPRAQGSGFASYGLPGRQFLPELEGSEEGALLDVEVHDDGRVILFCGRASAFRQEWQYVNDTVVVVLTRSLVTLAGQLGATAGYAGRWLLAVGVDELSGKLSASGFHLGRGYAPFSATTYVQGTEAGTTELLEQPGAVTRRLVGRLLRALGNRTVSATRSNAGGPQLHLSSTAGQGRPAQAMGAGRPFLGWREFEAMTSTCWGERRAGHRAVRGAA